MSGKKKKNGGDPRKKTSGRVTPAQPKAPKQNQIPNRPPAIIIDLSEVIEFIASPLEEIPTPEQTYRVEGFEAFNPLFDDDDYFLKMREAFAREMKLVQGNYYPDPALAHSAHLLFVERLVNELQDRIPELARNTQETLERFFRNRFERHSESGSFEKWDEEVLGGFFKDERLIRLAELGIPIKYVDEIVDGPIPHQAQGSFSTINHNFIVEGDEIAFVPSSITIFSVTVNSALREGYSFDEIVDGLARHALNFELLGYVCNSDVADIADETVDVQFGLTRATLNANLEYQGPPLGRWGHCGLLSALHCRLGKDIGIGYWAEQSMIELLDRYDPLFLERLFAAAIADGDQGRKHEVVIDTLKQFIDDVFDDPELIEPLKHMADRSMYGMEESAQLHHGLYTALLLDKHWGALSRAIDDATRGRQLDYTFFTTPQVVQARFNDLSR